MAMVPSSNAARPLCLILSIVAIAGCGGKASTSMAAGAPSTDHDAGSATVEGGSTGPAEDGSAIPADAANPSPSGDAAAPADAGSPSSSGDAAAPTDASHPSSSGDAGAPADAGSPSSSGDAAAPGTCGTVTFRMTTSNLDAGYTYVSSLSIPGDNRWWYAVGTADGGGVAIFPNGTTCAACGPTGGAIGFVCTPLSDAGVTASWDGTVITGASTCPWSPGNGETTETIACETTECAPAGSYTVTMCVADNVEECAGGTPGAPSGHCVTVPFEYPTSNEIVGTIP